MKRFDPGAPIELSPRAGGPGLGRVVLFGCAGLLVLLGIGAVVFVMKADDFLGWVFGSFQESVEARLPADLPRPERQRLDRAFDAAIEDILTGQADPAAMQRLQQELLEMTTTAEGEALTREQVAAVTLALEEVAGIASPEPPPRRARQAPPPEGRSPDGTSPPESAQTADSPAQAAAPPLAAPPRAATPPPAALPAGGEGASRQPERRTAPAPQPAAAEPSAAPAPRRSPPPPPQEPEPEEREAEAAPQRERPEREDLAPVIRLPPDEPLPEQDPPEDEDSDEPPGRP